MTMARARHGTTRIIIAMPEYSAFLSFHRTLVRFVNCFRATLLKRTAGKNNFPRREGFLEMMRVGSIKLKDDSPTIDKKTTERVSQFSFFFFVPAR